MTDNHSNFIRISNGHKDMRSRNAYTGACRGAPASVERYGLGHQARLRDEYEVAADRLSPGSDRRTLQDQAKSEETLNKCTLWAAVRRVDIRRA